MVSTKDILQLRQELRANGAFDKNPILIWVKFWFLVSALLLLIALSFHYHLMLILTPLCALVCTVAAMLGHEGAHQGAFTAKWANDVLFYLALTVLAGESACFWIFFHNQLHHPAPNVIGRDKDIDIWPLTSNNQYHKNASRLSQWMHKKIQIYILWPMTFFVAFDMKFRSLRYLTTLAIQRKLNWQWFIDVFCILLHYIIWIALPAYFFGLTKVLLFYFYIFGCVGCYLSAIFIVGHVGQPIVKTFNNYWHLQFATTRNIALPKWLSWCFVGLDYQIEHHIFPKISHFKLPIAQPIVQRFAEKHGLPYCRENFFSALAQVTKHQKNVWKMLPVDI